ncbi:MAG: hypothetical protein J5522_04615 [Lachnospiraceae bacterium]|nr:hypothetical protein [Lachnospiraceae bacterium]
MATKKKQTDNGYLHIKRESIPYKKGDVNKSIEVDWPAIFKLYNKHYTIVTDGLAERRRKDGD